MAPKLPETLTLRDRSVLDEEDVDEAQLLESREQEISEQPREISAPEPEVLVYQSEFQSGDQQTAFKKPKLKKKRKLADEEPDDTLDDYYVDIVKKPRVENQEAAAFREPAPEEPAMTTKAVTSRNSLAWLESLPVAEAEAAAAETPDVELHEADRKFQGEGSGVLQEEPLDASASSFVKLLRRRGLLRTSDAVEVAFQDKRGREFKGKEVFKEISRRFRGGSTMRKRI